ncbi:Nup2p, partial [Saccharomyces cerevisiae Vin13]
LNWRFNALVWIAFCGRAIINLSFSSAVRPVQEAKRLACLVSSDFAEPKGLNAILRFGMAIFLLFITADDATLVEGVTSSSDSLESYVSLCICASATLLAISLMIFL